MDTKWLADFAWLKLHKFHTIPGFFHLFASKNASTSLQISPGFLIYPHLFSWNYRNGWRLHPRNNHWDLPCLAPRIRNSQTSVLWYHHLRILSSRSCHDITSFRWWELYLQPFLPMIHTSIIGIGFVSSQRTYRGIQISWSCILESTQSHKAKLIRICNVQYICQSKRFDLPKSQFRIV